MGGIIRICKNKKAENIVRPYVCGMTIEELNNLYSHLETDSYDEFKNYVATTSNKRYKILFDVVADSLKTCLRS